MSGSRSIKNVVFDIGGVLLHVDFMPAIRVFASKAGCGVDEVIEAVFESEELEAYDRGRIGTEEFFRFLRRRFSIDLGEQELRRLWSDIFRENGPVAGVVRALKGKYPLFLISNTCRTHVEQFEAQFDLFGLFDERVYSCDVGLLKPERAIYELALSKFGVEAGKSVFIDDRPENVEAAHQAGFYGVHFKDNDRFLEEIRKLGLI